MVLKSLATNYGDVQGVAGATILGDGKIAMVLEPRAIVGAARTGSGGGGHTSFESYDDDYEESQDDGPPPMPTEILL